MECLVRYIERRRKTIRTKGESRFSTSRLTLGRGTDQDILIPDTLAAYSHGVIYCQQADALKIKSLAPSGIMVNGVHEKLSVLQTGDKITIGQHVIRVEKPVDEGIDLYLTVEKIIETQEAGANGLTSEPNQKRGISKRFWSWLFFIVALTAFLFLPIYSYLDEDGTSIFHGSALPDKTVWNSGKISFVHQYFSEDCKQCHLEPFKLVQDVACVSCHKNISHHADPKEYDLEEIDVLRCASCHKEHNGAEFLVRQDQAYCTECHQDIEHSTGDKSKLLSASDFLTDHPEFRPRLRIDKQYPVEDSRAWSRVKLKSGIKHFSGLKFSHYVHLDTKGIDSPEGNSVLKCADCHLPEAGGAYMLPVNMEQHCRSCHQMYFDENDPKRMLPHADVENILPVLLEYYAYRSIEKTTTNKKQLPQEIILKRRPGRDVSNSASILKLKPPFIWTKNKAEEIAIDIVEVRACGVCHEIERVSSSPVKWRFPKVVASQRWMKKALFDHSKHLQLECKQCHDANKSKKSHDVILPGIASCQECHTGQSSQTKMPSGCIVCHNFHQTKTPLLSDDKIKDQKMDALESLPIIQFFRKLGREN